MTTDVIEPIASTPFASRTSERAAARITDLGIRIVPACAFPASASGMIYVT